MTKTTTKNPYSPRCQVYRKGYCEVLLIDSTEDETLAKISEEHPNAVVVYGGRFWVNGIEKKRLKEVIDEVDSN